MKPKLSKLPPYAYNLAYIHFSQNIKHMTHYLILFLLILPIGCAQNESVASAPLNSETSLPTPSDNSAQSKAVETFHKLLWGELTETEVKTFQNECQANKEDVFCTTAKQLSALKKLISNKARVRQPPEIKPLIPFVPKFKGNLPLEWNKLRKAPVPNILKGLLSVNFEHLKILAKKATSEKLCPNNIAVAAAATLEDYLPTDIDPKLLGELYAQGANCSRKLPIDKEHFLTRAGLFHLLAKDPKTAVGYFSKVNPVDAFTGRALYWLYRTHRELGDTANAKKAFERLISHHRFSFHALLASVLEKSDIGSVMNQTLQFATRSKRLPKINPIIESAELLKKYKYDKSAAILVDWLFYKYERMESELKISLTKLGDERIQVSVVPSVLLFNPELISKESLELDFPKAFFPIFEKHKGPLSPYILLSIARRESTFDPKAVSPANAQGLLQMNPDTVKQLMPDKTPDLLDPDTSISIASLYFQQVSKRMEGNLIHTLGSYNAGEAAVNLWKKRYITSDPILWIDLIPYRETRDYIANVLSSYFWYQRIYENAVNLKEIIP